MKAKLFASVLTTMVGCTCALAQTSKFIPEDDIYYQPSEKNAIVEQKKASAQQHTTTPRQTSDVQIIVPASTSQSITLSTGRDVDEYNRRYSSEAINDNEDTQVYEVDPASFDNVRVIEESGYYLNGFNGSQSDYQYAERIRKFHSPKFALHISDPEFTDIYFLNSNDWNIYIDNNYAWVTPTWSNPWTMGYGSPYSYLSLYSFWNSPRYGYMGGWNYWWDPFWGYNSWGNPYYSWGCDPWWGGHHHHHGYYPNYGHYPGNRPGHDYRPNYGSNSGGTAGSRPINPNRPNRGDSNVSSSSRPNGVTTRPTVRPTTDGSTTRPNGSTSTRPTYGNTTRPSGNPGTRPSVGTVTRPAIDNDAVTRPTTRPTVSGSVTRPSEATRPSGVTQGTTTRPSRENQTTSRPNYGSSGNSNSTSRPSNNGYNSNSNSNNNSNSSVSRPTYGGSSSGNYGGGSRGGGGSSSGGASRGGRR